MLCLRCPLLVFSGQLSPLESSGVQFWCHQISLTFLGGCHRPTKTVSPWGQYPSAQHRLAWIECSLASDQCVNEAKEEEGPRLLSLPEVK